MNRIFCDHWHSLHSSAAVRGMHFNKPQHYYTKIWWNRRLTSVTPKITQQPQYSAPGRCRNGDTRVYAAWRWVALVGYHQTLSIVGGEKGYSNRSLVLPTACHYERWQLTVCTKWLVGPAILPDALRQYHRNYRNTSKVNEVEVHGRGISEPVDICRGQSRADGNVTGYQHWGWWRYSHRPSVWLRLVLPQSDFRLLSLRQLMPLGV